MINDGVYMSSMIYRISSLVIVFAFALAIVGCEKGNKIDVSLSGSNGEKINIKSDGENGKLSASGTNGEVLDIRSDNGEMTLKAQDNNGAKIDAKVNGSPMVSESELGVPFYPGSTDKPSLQIKSENKAETVLVSVRSTSDSPNKVMEFYQSKVTNPSSSLQVTQEGTNGTLTSKLESGAKFDLTLERKKGATETEVKISVTTIHK
jgi:hypothetical protein